MTEKEEKNIIEFQWTGSITGGTNINNIGTKFSGDASGGTINIALQKTCRICHRSPVGLEYQDECQCEKEGSYCEYCQSSESNKKSCSCRKKNSENKTAINQTVINYSGNFASQNSMLVGEQKFGDDSDFSTINNNSKEENIEEKLETKIEIPPINISKWHLLFNKIFTKPS